MSSEGINLIGNKLLIDELDSDEEDDKIEQTQMMQSINQYTDEGMDMIEQEGMIIDMGDGEQLNLCFPPDDISENNVSQTSSEFVPPVDKESQYGSGEGEEEDEVSIEQNNAK